MAGSRLLPIMSVLAAGLVSAGLVGWEGTQQRSAAFAAAVEQRLHSSPFIDPQAPCVCDISKVSNGWCRKHGYGWIAGIKITNAMLFDTMDAHGHDIDPSSLVCKACRADWDDNGFCDEHRMGFVDHRAYFSRLTFALAQGTPRARQQITCPTCRANAERYGWCDACGIGMIGNVQFTDRAIWQSAIGPFESLLAAIAYDGSCPACPSAIALDTTCPVCFTTYRAGKATGNARDRYQQFP
jgi:hypothetical protein